ncbi:MAG: DUF4198 domain-containing protein [Thermoplasmatales archaeon]|nr:DUF4198 domain-containing protein [Thermoplasmatales archaeon]
MERKTTKIKACILLATIILMGTAGTASAHFNFFLPDEWSMNTATANEVELIWGHPYEGIYFDAPTITEVGVVKPDGSKETLSTSDITVTGEEGIANAYKVSFTPDERGDYIIYADFEALHVEEEEVTWDDHVKAIIHYEGSTGWDHKTGQVMEIVPLTRPYGLEEGFVFVGQVFYNGNPLSEASVEIEKYYPVGEAPDPLPEEPMITRETKTDTNGVFSFTLDEPGIWITAATNTVDNVDIRGILLTSVEETFPAADTSAIDTLTSQMTTLSNKVADLEGQTTTGGNNTYALAALAIAIIAVLIAIAAITKADKKKKK